MIKAEFRRVGAAAVLVLLAACGGPPAGTDASRQNDAMQEASARLGDIVVRASALPTMALGDAVARQYGIARDPRTVLLLAGVRRGSDAQETAVPARVVATATDLLGKRQDIVMREVRSGAFVDYVGTATVIAPDTLRFDLDVVPQDGRRMTLQFNRDFFAQDR